MALTKTEAREIAKDTLVSAMASAYYRICDDESWTQEDADLIISYINKYGESACKAIGTRYYTS